MTRIRLYLTLFVSMVSVLATREYGDIENHCMHISGTFEIKQRNLFPESADWDPIHCKLYASALYNASAIQYDPYTDEIVEIHFPLISGNTSYHVAGVDYDTSSGSLYFAANAGAAWNFSALGQNLSGPNHLIKYNTNLGIIDWSVDMSSFQSEVMAQSGHLVAGFQDMAEDSRGNVYMIASFGDAIARVSSDGEDMEVFYNSEEEETKTLGIGALFSVGDTLVVSDSRFNGFLVFDTRATGQAVPRVVRPIELPLNFNGTWCDGLIAPSRYHGSVAICAIDRIDTGGGIMVFESNDNWQTINYKGKVETNNNLTMNATPTATVAIGNSIYVVEEFFEPTLEPSQPRDSFPFLDITSAVEELLC